MITITILDEVNCHIDGLNQQQLQKLCDAHKYAVKGAFQTIAFQMRQWDGKESIIDDEGFTYQFYLEQIIDSMERLGFDTDSIEFCDDRMPPIDAPSTPISDDYLLQHTGKKLRDHQLEAVNKGIMNRCGILDAATNAGKTLITVSWAKYFGDYLPTVTIVPTVKLLRQTMLDFKNCGLDVIAIDDKIKKNPDRIKKINKHRHTIITTKLLHNILQYEVASGDIALTGSQRAIFYDELHVFGDTMIAAFREHLYNCPIKIGMTGTVPKDKLKKAHIVGCLSGDVMNTVSVKYLLDNKLAAMPDITLVRTIHDKVDELCTPELVKRGKWDWPREFSYYPNKNRIAEIADFIQSKRDGTNTLVLCHPELGHILAHLLGWAMIDKDTTTDERDRLFSAYDESDEVTEFCASFGTSATGISQNNIHRMYIIDVGADVTAIKQGIGRGLRLDGKTDKVQIYDIYAGTYYGKKHATTRKSLYRKEGYPFRQKEETITVGE